MSFEECMIMLQDVAYCLPIDEKYISGCLTNFKRYIESARRAWTWFDELFKYEYIYLNFKI
ncbi:hypothetical protein AHAS_Ahas09G0174400 [Arachis hypogaea]